METQTASAPVARWGRVALSALPLQLARVVTLGPAARVLAVNVNGSAAEHTLVTGAQAVIPTVLHALDGSAVSLEIHYQPGPEIIPSAVESRVGDPNQGLKIRSLAKEGDVLVLEVEGIAGHPYVLILNHPDRVVRVEGGTLEENRILLRIPGAQDRSFRIHRLRLYLKGGSGPR